jgi:hypothetical protein
VFSWAHPAITLARHVSIHPSRCEKALAAREQFAGDGKHVIISSYWQAASADLRDFKTAGHVTTAEVFTVTEKRINDDTWNAIVAHILLSTEAAGGIKTVVFER